MISQQFSFNTVNDFLPQPTSNYSQKSAYSFKNLQWKSLNDLTNDQI